MENFDTTVSQRALLGAMIVDGLQNPENPTVILKATTDLQAKDITDRKTRELYQIMVDMYQHGDPFWDAVAIQNEAAQRKVLQGAEDYRYLFGIFEGAATATGVDYHIQEIKNARRRRDVAAFKARIANMPVAGFMETAETAFLELRKKTSDVSGVSTFSEITREAVSALEKAMKGGGYLGVPSGFPTIDKYTGGWQPGDDIIIAGRPSMGKSDIAKDFAKAAGVPVLYFSLEMSNIDLAKRHISGLCGVDFGRMKTGKITEDDAVKIIEGLNRKGNIPIFYNDKASLTIDEI